uniref:ATP-dependent Clp protease proteolytic subunit n=1 Tax=Dioncophyllum thollonii TaxID=122299 RepID=A0A411JQR9_9CARY|nr:clp protease proteolytic subunit [Dioncophyllum thollonii]QBC67441.1 clp protease proteolytic subunit [Dioncophyllum thollonii]
MIILMPPIPPFISVPKIPFRLPGELYRIRVLFLFQEIDDEVARRISSLIVYLTIEDNTKDLYLFVHSPGGFILSGIGIYDTVRNAVPHVNTIGLGSIASMGSLILAGGTSTKRFAFPHARVMIHQPASSYLDGKTGFVHVETELLMFLRDRVIDAYVESTGNLREVISIDLDRDDFMSATEAQAHGIVDFVVVESE